jgi:hypothetical protein
MPDFPLAPDPLAPTLAPLAAVPRRGTRDPPPASGPCEGCGAQVLVGRTSTGHRVALDTGVRTYVVDWDQGAPAPRLVESRGYPVHRCRP